jgi:ABC-type multidrug transport system ATPase subunit
MSSSSPTELLPSPGTAPALSAGRPAGRVLTFEELFATVNPIVIGREQACSVHLPHPTVSLYHAILERSKAGGAGTGSASAGDGLVVQDLESATGVFVNGRRIRQPHTVRDGDRIGVGPFLFTRRGDALLLLDSSQSLRLEARGLGREVPLAGGGTRRLLDDVNLVVRSGEFVTLLGPSGSGKSTLMDCLNGRRRATAGAVLANGQDFYEQFDSFRQSLGYVPQRDIVHAGLSVRRALYYTARLRLPIDTAPAEIERRVEEVLREMELGPHQHTMVGQLSGGQIKRVSLGAELLARPSLLYIDEATSGLDAGTEARMMRLFRHLADEGRSIVCITHAVENVDQCHLVIVLAGGRLTYYGPPGEAPAYFGVRTLSQVYDRLADRGPADWAAAFVASPYHKEFVEDRHAEGEVPVIDAGEYVAKPQAAAEPSSVTEPLGLAESSGATSLAPASGTSSDEAPSKVPDRLSSRFRASPRRPHGLRAWLRRSRRVARSIRLGWHQFRVLTNRYVELLLRDPRSLRLLLLQAPIVAVFLLVGFVNKPYQDEMPVARQLDEGERQLLAQVNAWNLVLADDTTLSDAQRAALRTLRFTVDREGKQVELRGNELHREINDVVHRGGASLRPELKAMVEKWQIRLEDVTPRATVSGKDLLATLNKASRSRLTELLLASKKPVVLMSKIEDPRFTYVLLNILCITVFWFGCNNAAKEIVKEEPIYARERAVNLRIFPYLGSKFVVLSVTSALQALLLSGTVYGILWWLHLRYGQDYPPETYMLPFGPQYAALALLSVVGVAVGLLMSACVSSPDRANALLPYVLIPQIILGGAIIPVKGEPINTLATLLSPVCWGFRAVHRGSNLLPDYHPLHQSSDFTVRGSCFALGVQMVVMLVATAWFLRMKDVGKR